ncbi:MAG: SET domain-containing protein [Dolichospermum sp.]
MGNLVFPIPFYPKTAVKSQKIMLHQSTELRFVNSEIGYGLFATEIIPKGTIISFNDPLDVEVKPEMFASLNVEFKAIIEHFAYVNLEGYSVISWDNDKYMNHSCDFNTIGTEYMLSIAVRDIAEGEEITTDYGLLDVDYDDLLDGGYKRGMLCKCGSHNCRKEIKAANKACLHLWISPMNEALNCVLNVKQPLLDFMDSKRKNNLIKSLQSNHDFSQSLLNWMEQREANFRKKWAKLLAEM